MEISKMITSAHRLSLLSALIVLLVGCSSAEPVKFADRQRVLLDSTADATYVAERMNASATRDALEDKLKKNTPALFEHVHVFVAADELEAKAEAYSWLDKERQKHSDSVLVVGIYAVQPRPESGHNDHVNYGHFSLMIADKPPEKARLSEIIMTALKTSHNRR